ncbi:hypothetical protein H8E50_06640 [bacterium]|nr:hypothetical protein [bacterium]
MKNEFYMDMISKSIIAHLSDEIAGNIKVQMGEFFREHLNKELSGMIAEQLSGETGKLKKELAGVENETLRVISDLQKHIDDNIAKLLKDDESQTAVLQELSDVKSSVEQIRTEQHEMLEGIIGKQLAGLTEELGGSFKEHIAVFSENKDNQEALMQELADVKSSVEQIRTEQHNVLEGMIAKQLVVLSEEMDSSIKDHLAAFKENRDNQEAVLLELSELKMTPEIFNSAQREVLEEIIDKKFMGLSEEIGGSLEKHIAALKEDGDNQQAVMTEVEKIKQLLRKNAEDQGDILAAISGKIETTVQEITQGQIQAETEILKKEIVEAENKTIQIVTDMRDMLADKMTGSKDEAGFEGVLHEEVADLKKIMEDTRQKQENLLKGVVGKDLMGLVGMIVSMLETMKIDMADTTKAMKAERQSTGNVADSFVNNIQDLKSYIYDAVEKITVNDGAGKDLNNDLEELKRAIQARDKEMSDLLNGVYYSIKKLTTSVGREREDSENIAAQFRNTLDNLYGHIRRLETEKDELSVDIMRFAGDEVMKSKFLELEKEVKKANSRTQKILAEKAEVEEKFTQLQERIIQE